MWIKVIQVCSDRSKASHPSSKKGGGAIAQTHFDIKIVFFQILSPSDVELLASLFGTYPSTGFSCPYLRINKVWTYFHFFFFFDFILRLAP